MATIARRQGMTIACPEAIARRMGRIDGAQLECLAAPPEGTAYGTYPVGLLDPGNADEDPAPPL